ncbi:division inhibitor protein [Corynebacterium occultum]|uniref:Division inhibitor protein n=1 Tax=Corynebacterium occultum TaxID=2675219 RepID=A0A6B8W4R1_9CORY|nr:TetR/AcrR family transcriptional regulator [Corynebacterium occultum]QGU07531.1 division inhibitor protein [Corynebacterium occultum]
MRADARERRERIINTACNLLRGRDIEGLTLEEVARAAGVGIATLYRNFPNRQALWHACIEHLMHEVNELQRVFLEDFASEPVDPLPLWHSFVRDLARLGLGALAQVMTPDNFQQLPPGMRELQAANDVQGRQVLTLVQEAGLVHSHITPHTLLKGLIILSRTAEPTSPGAIPELNRQLLRVYLAGLRQGPEELVLDPLPEQMDGEHLGVTFPTQES